MTISTSPRRGALALGVLSVVPLLLFVVAICGFTLDVIHACTQPVEFTEASTGSDYHGVGLVLFGFGVPAASLLTLGLVIFYAIDTTKNPAVPVDSRTVWVLILLIGSVLVFPVYWHRFWWRPRPGAKSARQTATSGR